MTLLAALNAIAITTCVAWAGLHPVASQERGRVVLWGKHGEWDAACAQAALQSRCWIAARFLVVAHEYYHGHIRAAAALPPGRKHVVLMAMLWLFCSSGSGVVPAGTACTQPVSWGVRTSLDWPVGSRT